MYAVIESGGKQHRVAQGDKVHLEKLEGGAGDTVSFDQVLLVADGGNVKVGTPTVAGARVTGRIVTIGRHKKIRIFTYKRRKNQRHRAGHRQWYTLVEITGIAL